MVLSLPSGPYNIARRTDFNSLVDAMEGNGVHNGMAVTANGSGLGLNVAAGAYTANGTKVQYAGASPAVTLSAADATYSRFDIIVADSAGNITAVKGVAGVNPHYPAIPSGKIRLAIVYVSVGLVTLSSVNVFDASLYVPISKGTATITNSTSSVTVSDRAITTNSKVLITCRVSPAWSSLHTHNFNFTAGGTFSFQLNMRTQHDLFVKSGSAATGITGMISVTPSSYYFWVDTIVDGTSFKINSKSTVNQTITVDYTIIGG